MAGERMSPQSEAAEKSLAEGIAEVAGKTHLDWLNHVAEKAMGLGHGKGFHRLYGKCFR